MLLARLLPVVRTLVSFPAGMAGMPFGTFSGLTLLGSLLGTHAFWGQSWALAATTGRAFSGTIDLGSPGLQGTRGPCPVAPSAASSRAGTS